MPKNKFALLSARNGFIIAAIIAAAAASFFTFNYVKTKKNNPPAPNKDTIEITEEIIEIREKMFATQVNDVYMNTEDYLGKTIKLEGIFKEEQGYDRTYCFVVRYGPGGCCGMDANVGFEVAWAKENTKPFPADNSWVEATGVLKSYEEDGYFQYLYLDLSSLNTLTRRGAETVKQ